MVKYNIISTGSDGNATILEDFVLVDCGVPYKALEPYVPKLKLVLLTHIHSDHFQKRTIKRLASERPTLRFGCCRWLVPVPWRLAALKAWFFEFLTNPPFTRDQLILLKTDNTVRAQHGGRAPDIESLGILPTPLEEVLPSYISGH